MITALFGGLVQVERLNLTGHVVKVDGNRFFLLVARALHSDLEIACRESHSFADFNVAVL